MQVLEIEFLFEGEVDQHILEDCLTQFAESIPGIKPVSLTFGIEEAEQGDKCDS